MQTDTALFIKIVVFAVAIFVFGVGILAIFEPSVRSARSPLAIFAVVAMLGIIGLYNRRTSGRILPGLESGETLHQVFVKRSGLTMTIVLYILIAAALAHSVVWLSHWF
jgi:hypothetical protein